MSFTSAYYFRVITRKFKWTPWLLFGAWIILGQRWVRRTRNKSVLLFLRAGMSETSSLLGVLNAWLIASQWDSQAIPPSLDRCERDKPTFAWIQSLSVSSCTEVTWHTRPRRWRRLPVSQGDLALPDRVLDSLCFISSCKKPRLLSANRKGIKTIQSAQNMCQKEEN